MEELIEKMSNAIANNDVTGLAEDFVLLSAQIKNLQDDNANLKTQYDDMTKTLEKNTSELNTNRQLLADLVRKVGADNLVNQANPVPQKSTDEIDFDKILNS